MEYSAWSSESRTFNIMLFPRGPWETWNEVTRKHLKKKETQDGLAKDRNA